MVGFALLLSDAGAETGWKKPEWLRMMDFKTVRNVYGNIFEITDHRFQHSNTLTSSSSHSAEIWSEIDSDL